MNLATILALGLLIVVVIGLLLIIEEGGKQAGTVPVQARRKAK